MVAGSIFRQMNWVDIFVLILLIQGTYVGLKHGLLSEIFTIFGIIVALFVSIHYYPNTAQFLSRQVFFSKLSTSLNEGLSFVCLLLAVMFIFKLGRFVAQFIMHFEISGPLERMGGVVCGFIRGGVVAALILFALNLLPLSYLKKSINRDSLSGPHLIKVGPAIYHMIIRFSPDEKNK